MLDRTPEFRKLLGELQASLPLSKHKPKSQRPRRSSGASARTNNTNDDDQLSKSTASAYMQDAYTILKHIQSLTKALALVKRPYLNVEHNDMMSVREANLIIDIVADSDKMAAQRYLTSHQRDQVDLQAKMIISRCAGQVRAMEAIEKKRAEHTSSRTSKLLRLLPARLTHQDGTTVASEYLAAHNASVTWYLNRRLAEASQLQKEMQEERIKRQLERTRTLGSAASNPNRTLAFTSNLKREASGDDDGTSSWLPGSFTSMTASSTKTQLRPTSMATTTSFDDFEDDTDEEIELSQSQIQQFEEENATILREAQDSLAAVQQAESRLMEISALQMELVNHLTQQAEITDQLYEDAIEAGATVSAGNKQLIEARRRQKDSRLFILVFLLGATLALLFLHNY